MNASVAADGFIRSKFKQSNGRAKILVLHQPKMLGFICSQPQLIVIDLTQRHNKFQWTITLLQPPPQRCKVLFDDKVEPIQEKEEKGRVLFARGSLGNN